MSDTNEIDVVIGEDASVTFIWTDALADLVPAGYTCEIKRASHCEPTHDGRWTADMRPAFLDLMTEAQRGVFGKANGPDWWTGLTLGPFGTRAEALLAERLWLREYAGV